LANVNNGAVLEVVIHSTLAAQRQMTVLHYVIKEMSAPADQFSILETIDDRLAAADGIYDAIADVSGNDCEFQSVQLQWIYPVRYAYRKFASMPLIGQFAEPCYPPNVSVTITKKGVEAGRKNIGAVHMPNVPNGAILNGHLDGAAVALYETLATRLKTNYTLATTGTLVPIIAHRAALAESPEVVSAVLQFTSRVQRRRTVGLGI